MMDISQLLQNLQGGQPGISINGGANPLPLIQPEIQMPEPPVNISDTIQQLVGAKEPASPTLAQNILSNRFQGAPQIPAQSLSMQTAQAPQVSDYLQGLQSAYQQGPSFGDYATGIIQSAIGKPTLGNQAFDARIKGQLDMIGDIGKLGYYQSLSANRGGATMAAAQQIMQDNPGMSFTDAFTIAKSGLGQGVTYSNGQVTTLNGAPQAAGQMAYGKKTGTNQSDLEYEPQIKQESARATKIGENTGDIENRLNSVEGGLPALTQSASHLSDLGKAATYTIAGVQANNLRRQLGLPASQGAISREEYINYARDNVFPQLRATFGAQFTEREGERLLATFGDPNKSPEEKDAALKALIDSHVNQIASLKNQLRTSPGNSSNSDPLGIR